MSYQRTVLDNGLRIVTHAMKNRDSAALGFLVSTGGRYEEDHLKGAAHFLEHILFKGSQKYSCEEIKESIEGIGGTLNAFTAEEVTCYYAKIPAKHLRMTFDVLSDMVFRPIISPEDVQKESAVIIEEIKMYHDLPQYRVMELLDALMWPDHPLGKNLTGTEATVGSMTSENLHKFHSEYYSPHNIVIAACGRLEHEKFVRFVKKYLNKISKTQSRNFLPADNSQSHPRVHFLEKNIEQMHLALGTLGLPEGHKDRYIFTLLNIIMGGNMSSRLFNEIREKRGLAYSIGSGIKSYKDSGIFMVRAGVDNQKIVKTLEVVLQEFKKMKEGGINKSEFTRAKDYAIGQLLLSMEETMDHMLWIGEETVSHDKIRTLKNVINQVNKVTMKDIQRLADDIFNEQRFNLALVGPITEDQKRDLRALMGVR